MCLNIGNRDLDFDVPNMDVTKRTNRAKKSKKPIKAYKALRRNDRNGRLTSVYVGSEWIPGKVKISSRKKLKKPTELTSAEKYEGVVTNGLHFYTSCKIAKGMESGYEIWEVEIKPQDIVSYGTFCGAFSLVAHKAKLVRKVK